MTEHSDDLLHIASCRTCRDRFTAHNVATLPDDRRGEPGRMREFLETARRLERERDGVEDLVARLLRRTPPSHWDALANAPELRSSAAVEQLIEEVRNRVERTPAEALKLADAATSIAEALPAHSYPPVVLAQLRAMAWKERALALRCLTNYESALTAIDTAEAHLSGFAGAAFDRAVIHLAKAIILRKLERNDEANALLDQSRQVFEDYGDSKMLLAVTMTEAAFLYNQNRHAEARKLFTDLRDVVRASHDVESLARIENNLGYCATYFGDFTTANIHFSNSIAFFNDVGAPLEAMRAQRGAGRVLIAKGQINAGLAYLRNARRAFAEAHVADEAALCGLEIVDTLVQRADTAAALELAQQIAQEVAAAGMPPAAVNALQKLEESLRDGDTEVSVHVQNVHAVLESLQHPNA